MSLIQRLFTALRAPERRRSRRGMSLVEVMVVIAIIVILMGIIGYGIMTVFSDAQGETTKLGMHEVNKRIELYTLKKGGAPSSSEGLKVVYGSDEPPKDSWGHEYIYTTPGPDGMAYDIVSYGSDGVEGGTGNAEDIRWSAIKK